MPAAVDASVIGVRNASSREIPDAVMGVRNASTSEIPDAAATVMGLRKASREIPASHDGP
jgi:hypothetical protein